MRIAIIGCGNMGKGLAERLSKTNQLFFYNHRFEKAECLEKGGYGRACREVQEALDHSEIVILAVKPQNIKEVAEIVGRFLQEGQIMISLLTGTTIAALKEYFPNSVIVRMMPNLALIYGEGVIGLSADKEVTKEQRDLLTKTFDTLGKIYWLPEEKINALTALTGSGPAFVFALIEAMVDAGLSMGFSAKEAQGLVYQMLKGSLTLLEETQKHPGELKWQITSPGGTTIAGLRKLEESALRGGVINTFLAAYERANELSS